MTSLLSSIGQSISHGIAYLGKSAISAAVYATAISTARTYLDFSFIKWMQKPYQDDSFKINTRAFKTIIDVVCEKVCFLKLFQSRIVNKIETRENFGYSKEIACIVTDAVLPQLTARNIQAAGSLVLQTGSTVASAMQFANSAHPGIARNETAFLAALGAPDAPDQMTPNKEHFLQAAKAKTAENLQTLLDRIHKEYKKSGQETWKDKIKFWAIGFFVRHFGAAVVDRVLNLAQITHILNARLELDLTDEQIDHMTIENLFELPGIVEYLQTKFTPEQVASFKANLTAYGNLGLWYSLERITDGLCSLDSQSDDINASWQGFMQNPTTVTEIVTKKFIKTVKDTAGQTVLNWSDLDTLEKNRQFLATQVDLSTLISDTLPDVWSAFS